MNKVKGFALYLALFWGVIGLAAQTQEWLWASSTGSILGDHVAVITTDDQGNSIVAGTFRAEISFGNTTLISYNTEGLSVYIAKISKTGNWMWARKLENTNSYGLEAQAATTDSNGNIIVSGRFWGLITVGQTNLYSYGNQDIYIAKIDPDGNWIWARKMGSVGDEYCRSITTDDANNVYLTGEYHDNLYVGSTVLTYSGWGSDIFIIKMDSTGNWIWANNPTEHLGQADIQ